MTLALVRARRLAATRAPWLGLGKARSILMFAGVDGAARCSAGRAAC